MKKRYFIIACYLMMSTTHAQLPEIKMGEEFTTSMASTEFDIIGCDDTGIYVMEGYTQTKGLIFGTKQLRSALIKLDKDKRNVYKVNYDDILKGKNFLRFFFTKTAIFLIAIDDNPDTKSRDLFSLRLSKETGNPIGDWQLLATSNKTDKTDVVNSLITYAQDSSTIAAINLVQGKENTSCQITLLDESLQPIGSPILLVDLFNNKTTSLFEVLYTREKNILLITANYAYEEGKKIKDEHLFCTGFGVRMYNNKGILIKEQQAKINGKWLIHGKTNLLPNDIIMLTVFASTKKDPEKITTMEVKRIEMKSGNIISDNLYDLEEWLEKNKQETNSKQKPSLPNKYIFRKCIPTIDSGLIIVAEVFAHIRPFPGERGPTEVIYGDIMTIKLDKYDKISWMKLLTKVQSLDLEDPNVSFDRYRNGYKDGHGFFTADMKWPFFSGIGMLLDKDNLYFLFNDKYKNKDVIGYEKYVPGMYTIGDYNKTTLFSLSTNIRTGECTRRIYMANDFSRIAMPRFIYQSGNKCYLLYRQNKPFGNKESAFLGEISW